MAAPAPAPAPALDLTGRGARAKALRRLASQVLAQLHLACKVQQLYGADNDNVRSAQDALYERLQDAFGVDDNLRLHVEDGYLFANEVRLRVDRAAQEAHFWTLDRFADSGVASIRFGRGLKAVELRKFLPIFATAQWPEGSPAPPIPRRLEEAFVIHVTVGMRRHRDPAAEENDKAEVSGRHLAIAIWRRLHSLCTALTGAMAKGEPLAVRPVRQVVQLAADLLLQGEVALIALSAQKNYLPTGIEARSPWQGYLECHMTNVAVLAMALGARAGLARRELLELGAAAACADVGMAAVPVELRERAGPLTAAERAVVAAHALHGAEALLAADGGSLQNHALAVVAATHHAAGPADAAGKAGPEPSLHASLVAVVDAYDALTTERPWRPAFGHAEALREVCSAAAGHAPLLARLFAAVLGVFPAGTLVELTTGEVAVVVEQSLAPGQEARPRVKLLVAKPAGAEGQVIDLAERAPGGGFRRAVARRLDLEALASSPGDLVALL
jgi:HD-GYP domain-containing protein (c-di-GMP phosphodiesterase class II)